MSQQSSDNFTLVQALRGIAAFWVVLFHASEGHHIDALKARLPSVVNAALFDDGHYGVAIFFGLSGFVIAHSLRNMAPTGRYFLAFVARRSVRLDPPYWLSMAIVIGLGWMSAHVRSEPFSCPTAGTILAHLFYVPLLTKTPLINSVYWTLTYEVQFYLFFCGVLVIAGSLGRRWRTVGYLAWGLMFLLACASAIKLVYPAIQGLFVGFWDSFFIGALAYRAAASRWAVAGLLALAALMFRAAMMGDSTFEAYAASTALLLAVTHASGHIYTALSWQWIQALGAISYSLYLLHNPITGAVGFVAHRLLGDGLMADATTLAALVVVTITVSALYWFAVERIAQKLARRIRLPTSRAAPLPGPNSLPGALKQATSTTVEAGVK